MITTIGTVAVYVDDQEKSLDFWTRQVGFSVHATYTMEPEGSWIEVGPADAAARLVLYPKRIMPDWAERKTSVVFNADDIHRTYEEMTARGVRFSQAPRDMAWGPFAIFEDIDGNSFGLRQPT